MPQQAFLHISSKLFITFSNRHHLMTLVKMFQTPGLVCQTGERHRSSVPKYTRCTATSLRRHTEWGLARLLCWCYLLSCHPKWTMGLWKIQAVGVAVGWVLSQTDAPRHFISVWARLKLKINPKLSQSAHDNQLVFNWASFCALVRVQTDNMQDAESSCNSLTSRYLTGPHPRTSSCLPPPVPYLADRQAWYP